jgi:hypothetical protein
VGGIDRRIPALQVARITHMYHVCLIPLLPKKEERKETRKRRTTKPQMRREIIKIRAEINQMKTR